MWNSDQNLHMCCVFIPNVIVICHVVGQIMDLGDEPLLMRTCRGRHFDRFLFKKKIATRLTVKNWREINDALKNTQKLTQEHNIVSLKVA